MNILILGTQVPFSRGGAEVLLERLREELNARGHRADIVQFPFICSPKQKILEQISLWRSLDLSAFSAHKVDLVIPTKFPTYMVPHPNKIPWLIHQYRQAYELHDSRFGDFQEGAEDEALRRMIWDSDRRALDECKKIFTISSHVSSRMKRYLDIEAESLTPPLPLGVAYRKGNPSNYILSVGRICSIKRVDLLIRALPQLNTDLVLKIAGAPDEPGVQEYLESEIQKHHLSHRVEFLGRVSDSELIDLYANAFLVYYAPFDEDYGFVTLEAFASGCPVVTASDSGCAVEFVEAGANDTVANGIVVEPEETALAEGINALWDDKDQYSKLRSGVSYPENISNWDQVVNSLISGLSSGDKLPENQIEEPIAACGQ